VQENQLLKEDCMMIATPKNRRSTLSAKATFLGLMEIRMLPLLVIVGVIAKILAVENLLGKIGFLLMATVL
jgi:hypothetical protein